MWPCLPGWVSIGALGHRNDAPPEQAGHFDNIEQLGRVPAAGNKNGTVSNPNQGANRRSSKDGNISMLDLAGI